MQSTFHCAVEVVAHRRGGQDRAAVAASADGLVIALADGAGGTGRGAAAADAVIAAATAAAERSPTAVLEDLDRTVARLGGQTTAVILHVTPQGIMGASAGDSGAWVIRGHQVEALTEAQHRKPLVGAGCVSREIRAGALGAGTLVVASDGLWSYARRDDIVRIADIPDLVTAARALIELVRLPSGGLPDDVAVVLCREAAFGAR